MEGLELTCFEIISNVGAARSLFIDSIKEAKKGNFEKAQQLNDKGKKSFLKGHHAHTALVTNEAKGNGTDITLLLIHAEDQLMSAESFKILSTELMDICKKNALLEEEMEKLKRSFAVVNEDA